MAGRKEEFRDSHSNKPPAKDHYDLIIVGGGLAGCLLFAAIRYHHPHIRLLLLEQNQHLGGNHTWCFHDHDLPKSAKPWLQDLISKSWPGYEVHFPTYSRTLNTPYHSIRSEDLHQKIINKFSKDILLNTKVEKISTQDPRRPHPDGHAILLSNHSRLYAHTVIECKGWTHAFASGSVAYQKFVGLDVKLKKPHGLERVTLKDVRIPQIDGYRFFYVLPWSEDELLIEDTYYSNHSILKDERIELEIKKYAEQKGWEIDRILRKEIGCLPLTLYPPKTAPLPLGSPSVIGAQSLVFNPVTGYTFPQTIQMVEAIAARSSLTQDSISKEISRVKDKYTRHDKYFRLLNRMMFLAATPDKRYIILERFYRLKEDLIQRFYSGTITATDKIRLLVGKPPVPITKAVRVLNDRKNLEI